MKTCSHCGEKISDQDKFCPACEKEQMPHSTIAVTNTPEKNTNDNLLELTELSDINRNIKLQNNQAGIAKKTLIWTGIFFIITILPFVEGNPLSGIWALTMVGLLGFLTSFIMFWVFRSRAKKMDALISGEKVMGSWQMDENLKKIYVDQFYKAEVLKNRAIFSIITVFIVVIFGAFIIFMKEGKGFMALMGLGILVIIGFFAFYMPVYYRNRNLKGDGKVLLGKNFAYINGFFHNWDFPLSGLKKVKVIRKPFYGLFLSYYYTDRTLTHSEDFNIPAPDYVDIVRIVEKLEN